MAIVWINLWLELCSLLFFLLCSTALVALSARRAWQQARPARAGSGGSSSGAAAASVAPTTVTLSAALLLPLFASAVLLLLFYYFAAFGSLLVLYTLLTSAAAVGFAAAPALPAARGGLGGSPYAAPAALGVSVVLAWAWLGGAALGNLVAACTCVALVALVRLPSLKVAAVALAGLLAYDVFMVFFSARFFGESVMVSVATQAADNPVRTAAAVDAALPAGLRGALPLPVRTLGLPNKLVLPVLQWEQAAGLGDGSGGGWALHAMMLGLGDVALPALLAALAYVADTRAAAAAAAAAAAEAAAAAAASADEAAEAPPARSTSTAAEAERAPLTGSVAAAADAIAVELDGAASLPQLPPPHARRAAGCCSRLLPLRALARDAATLPLFRAALAGYAVGLLIAMLASSLFSAAQPALLYIVPCTFAPLLLRARRDRRAFALLWHGQPAEEEEEAAATAAAPPGGEEETGTV